MSRPTPKHTARHSHTPLFAPLTLAIVATFSLTGCETMAPMSSGSSGSSGSTSSSTVTTSASSNTSSQSGGTADVLTTQLNSLFDGLSSILGGTSADFRKLVEGGQYSQAVDFYAKNKAELDSSKSARPWINKLAERLNERDTPEANDLASRLAANTQAMLPPTKWAETALLFSRTDALVLAHDNSPILSQPDYRSTSVKMLKAQAEQTKARLNAESSRQFSSYLSTTQGLPQDFFAQYPVKLAPDVQKTIAIEQAESLAKTMPDATLERNVQLLDFFAQAGVDAKTSAALTRAWQSAYAKDKKWPANQPLTLPQRLESARQLQTQVPQWKGATIQTTVITMLNDKLAPARRDAALESVNGAVKRWGASLSAPVPRDALIQQLESMQHPPADLIVLIDTGRIVAAEGPQEPSSIRARFLARQENCPNPDRPRLQAELASAEAEWRQAEQLEQQAQQQAKAIAAQSKSAFGAIGVLGLVGTSSFATAATKSRVQELTQQLASTPANVSSPVYESYERKGTKARLLIGAPTTVYFFDPNTKQLASVDLNAVTTKEYAQYENAHPADTRPSAVNSEKPEAIIETESIALLRTSMDKIPDLLAAATGQGMTWSADPMKTTYENVQLRQREWVEKQKATLVK